MKIAVVQQNGAPGRGEENLRKALCSLEEAVRNNCDIILFHEEMIHGYHENGFLCAEKRDSPACRAFQSRLKGSDAMAVYGYTEKGEDGKLYISVNAVTAQGLQATYRKTHLWKLGAGLRDETLHFTPENGLVTLDFMGVRIGFLICFDGDYGEMFRAYARRDCSLILWSNNRFSRGAADKVRDAAVNNSLFVASYCCCGLNESGRECEGLSSVVGPDGRILAGEARRETTVIADIDPADALAHRKNNPFFESVRYDLYYADLINETDCRH